MNKTLLTGLFTLLALSIVVAKQPIEEEVKLTEYQAHEFFSAELNNRVWELLGKADRTDEEDNEMIWAAYASLYHWSVIGLPVNIQRGEWMISHVWAVLGHSESALYHADRCWQLTEKLQLVGFDRGYALEALARANASAGNIDIAQSYFAEAKAYVDHIHNPEDAELYLSDLHTGPWFGLFE